MARPTVTPTGRERYLAHEDLIVSKTDLKGHITYANRVFLEIADYTEAEMMGQAHNIIRHPDMPRTIYQLLWERIRQGKEIFAYVKNLCKNGDHYWVFAHVTPTFDGNRQMVGYHSNRRAPDRPAVEAAERLYRRLLRAEASAASPKEQLVRGRAELQAALDEEGVEFEKFCFALWDRRSAA